MQWLTTLVEQLLTLSHAEQLRLQETTSPDPLQLIAIGPRATDTHQRISYLLNLTDPQTDDPCDLWVVLDLNTGNAWLSNGLNCVSPLLGLVIKGE